MLLLQRHGGSGGDCGGSGMTKQIFLDDCVSLYSPHVLTHTLILQQTYRIWVIQLTPKKMVRFSCARRNDDGDNSFDQSTNWLTTIIFLSLSFGCCWKDTKAANIKSVTYHLWHKSMWFFHSVVIHPTYSFFCGGCLVKIPREEKKHTSALANHMIEVYYSLFFFLFLSLLQLLTFVPSPSISQTFEYKLYDD